MSELFSGDNIAATRTIESLPFAVAEERDDLLEADAAVGIWELFVGRLQSVRERFERRHALDLLAINEAQRVRYHAYHLSDRIVDVGNVLSHAQWLMGAPDCALRTAHAMVEHARNTKRHLTLSNSLSWVCPVFYWAGRYEECARHVTMLEEHTERHGFTVRRPLVMFYRAALSCAQAGAPEDAVEMLVQSVDEFRSSGYRARLPFYLGVLAELLAKRGRGDEALTTISAALDRAHEKNDRWCLPELLRIRAKCLAAQGNLDRAEADLVESMALAQQIHALSWRRRAGNDLAELWFARARHGDARQMLLPIFQEFREGFATHDLIVAANLLEVKASGRTFNRA